MLQEINAFTLVIIGSGLIFLIVAIFLIIYYRYANKLIGESVKNNQLKLDHQSDLLKNEIKAIDNERARLARDLHDEVGALLSYISMNMSATAELNSSTQLQKGINENRKSLDDAIQKVRQISHSLLPPTLDLFGLEIAIEEFTSSIKTNFIIDFKTCFDLKILQKNQQLHLYRLIMEFVNNSVKHSKGDLIRIEFRESKDLYKLYLSDNGKGFDYDEAMKKSGLGLKNFESRLSALEADYTINSNNKGTQVKIHLRKF